MEKILNYIGGRLCEPVSEKYFDNINPAKGEAFSKVPDSDIADFQLALKHGKEAYATWSDLSFNERADYLLKIANEIELQIDALALAEVQDTGKPLSLAKRVDIPRAAENFKFFAHAITQFSSEAHHSKSAINYTLRQPLGVVACISPWNLPLYLFTWKIAPALAAGNIVIAKPSELTPYSAFLLSKICIKVGLPPGVLNILHGSGAKIGEPLVQSSEVKAVSFTGGTHTGKRIAAISAPLLRKTSLELGGKNPALVFNDCDLEATVNHLVKASFTNQGEICLCASRLYVQRDIYEKFKRLFIEQVKAIQVGDPLLASTDMGALISITHLRKVEAFIQSALDEGGLLLCGNEEILNVGNGYFLRPHVFEGLGNNCKINQEEVFGPVVTLQVFDTEEEVIALANDSTYGLAATVWTENVNTANRVASKLQTGIVWVNTWMDRDLRTPFGGMKSSGLGREGGIEALRFFTEPKNVCIAYK